jgi:CBS domain-containing protein
MTMKVREILEQKGRRVITIRPDATISTAVHRMALERIGALVVSEDGASIAGILSERDVMRGLAQDGGAIMNADRRVADLMTTGVRTCGPDDTIKSVMAEMTRRRFRHMPVVEGGRLTGLISIGDAVKSRLDEMELETVVLREAYIAGH